MPASVCGLDARAQQVCDKPAFRRSGTQGSHSTVVGQASAVSVRRRLSRACCRHVALSSQTCRAGVEMLEFHPGLLVSAELREQVSAHGRQPRPPPEEIGEDTPEPERLLDRLRPDHVVTGSRRVALVEDQVRETSGRLRTMRGLAARRLDIRKLASRVARRPARTAPGAARCRLVGDRRGPQRSSARAAACRCRRLGLVLRQRASASSRPCLPLAPNTRGRARRRARSCPASHTHGDARTQRPQRWVASRLARVGAPVVHARARDRLAPRSVPRRPLSHRSCGYARDVC
jgi:hypothetical protein